MSRFTIQIIIATTIAILSSNFAHAGKGKGPKGDDDGGFMDATFIVDSFEPDIPPTPSQSADSKGQIVFYGQMNLQMFTGTWSNDDSCSNTLEDGIIVIYPQSQKNPYAAELIFWFDRELDNGKEVTHLLTMTGVFTEPDNWPPSVDNIQNQLELTYWEFAAENPKAQRNGCSGYGHAANPDEPWKVTVTRDVQP